MKWTEKHIAGIVSDLAEEDFFACQALFRIAQVEFTKRVPTLAVSLSASPVLYINREFLEKHALSENDVKAVLMHEFLHVILQHTEQFDQVDPLLNIALDAIINSIIHRSYGNRFSDFFRRFYKPEGLMVLLRPCDPQDFIQNRQWERLHLSIYSGILAANDLYELIRHLSTFRFRFLNGHPQVIGNHGAIPSEKSENNRKLLEGILGKMDGTRIWNNCQTPGVSDLQELETRRMKARKLQEWKRDTRRLLEKCLLPDRTRRDEGLQTVPMPFLRTGDRRAFAQLKGSRFLPFSEHGIMRSQPRDTVTVYLDVSGSMRDEIDSILLLLSDLRSCIRTPLWVFSNKVEPAFFRNGSIEYKSTGGTSISCVFDHIREHRFRRSLIVTDGYVEEFTDTNLNGVAIDGLRVLISASGQPALFNRHGICYHQLPFLKK